MQMPDISKHILVVEDEKPLAKALVLKLTTVGFTVKVAYDGQEAVGLLASEPFDLVLLDLIMPRMDGFGVLEWMNKQGKHPKVIVLTNLGQEEDIAKIKSMGVDDYFVKANISLTDLVERIKVDLGA
ncbi:MAG TPA: response regulator [Candidatus Paceibacterota bacterium]|nr:response regulator [Candidatus Paceibacterota bacterium]